MECTGKQVGQLEADNAHQFIGFRGLLGDDSHLIRECLTKLLIGNGESGFELSLNDGLVEELRKGFRHLTLHQLGDRLEGISCVLELLEVFKGNPS